MFSLRLAASAVALSVAFASAAHANMPPKKFDQTYTGKFKQHRVAFVAVKAMCEKISVRRYGAHYAASGGLAGVGPTYGCAFTDEGMTPEIVYSYDTPALAKARAAKGSKQGYDQCMEFNSFVHERGHLIAALKGIDTSAHAGWNGVSRCTYGAPPPAMPAEAKR